ncbi:MAG: hypothetical protein CML16_03195 [Pusillimonas sp.]|nr:hypothetical protein [Pusillimonas sp.]MBC43593.1 hypothetical protein [Pusillimonas sp.]HCP79406.1 hypothetical protein [Pusillimonas sp.]|tara:strand:- start:8749 stop:9021 length:273 start_codon:yes stop_codon:yes gene_type:complete
MDIEQAIERVRTIDRKIDSIKRFMESGFHIKGNLGMSSGTWRVELDQLFSPEERTALIERERERERLESERAKLTPVIDMANAALKGLMT